MRRKVLIVWVVLLGFLSVLVAIYISTENNQQAQKSPSSPPSSSSSSSSGSSEATTVSVLVVGEPGTSFSCSYGSASNGQTSVDGTLTTDQPIEYKVPVKSGASSSDSVTAICQRKSKNNGQLAAEIASGGYVMALQQTAAAYGEVTTTWNTTEQ